MTEEQNNQVPGTQPVQPVQPVQPEPPIQAQVTDAPVAPPMPQDTYPTTDQAPTPGAVPPPAPGQAVPVAYAAAAKPEGDSKGTASLVLGILSIVFCGPVVGLILGIIAIVFGRQSKKMLPAGYPSGKATGGLVTGVIGVVLSVLTTIAIVVTLIAGMAIVGSDEFSDAMRNSSSYSTYSSTTPDADKAVEQAGKDALDKACNLDADTLAIISKNIDSSFTSSAGFPLSDLGISSDELAQWMTSGATYTITDATAMSSTGYVTATAETLDMEEFLYIWEDDVLTWSQDADEAALSDEAALKTQMGTLLRGAMEKTPHSTKYIFIDVTKAGDQWIVSEADQADLLDQLYEY